MYDNMRISVNVADYPPPHDIADLREVLTTQSECLGYGYEVKQGQGGRDFVVSYWEGLRIVATSNRITINGSIVKAMRGATARLSTPEDASECIGALGYLLDIPPEAMRGARVQRLEICKDIVLTNHTAGEIIDAIQGVRGYSCPYYDTRGYKLFRGNRWRGKGKAPNAIKFYDKAKELRECQGIETNTEILRTEIELTRTSLQTHEIRTIEDICTPQTWDNLQTYLNTKIQSITMSKHIRPEQIHELTEQGKLDELLQYQGIEKLGGIGAINEQLKEAYSQGRITERQYKYARGKYAKVYKEIETILPVDTRAQELKSATR